MKNSIFLYLKQGIKGVLKFKIQFISIVILSFLAIFVLSVSLSSTSRLSQDYDTAMSKMEPFSYVNDKNININRSEYTASYINAPLDLINEQFIRTINSADTANNVENAAYEMNFNISNFTDNSEYPETFLTKTFADKDIQKAFLEMISNRDFWVSIFDYNYDPLTENLAWDPFGPNSWYASYTAYTYLQTSSNSAGNIWNFFSPAIEKLKENYLYDLFENPTTPTYIQNTLFAKLKEKDLISMANFENKTLTDNTDTDIYSRYLYFTLEAFLRQIIRQACEYPTYWIQTVANNSSSREKENISSAFNNLNASGEIGFNWLNTETDSTNTDQNLNDFATTIFAWIFGFSTTVSNYTTSSVIENKFVVSSTNKAWSNFADYSVTYKSGEYLQTRSEVFSKGMRGSFTQLLITLNSEGKINSVDKTFSGAYLKHWDDGSLDNYFWNAARLAKIDYYKTNFNYEKITTEGTYFLKKYILAQAFGFEYNPRPEIQLIDSTTEISYRIISIEAEWKDRITLYEGHMPNVGNEILINSQFARANGYKIGSNIQVGGNNFSIAGFATDPLSYYPLADLTVPLPNSKKNAIIYSNNANMQKMITGDYQNSISTKVLNLLTYSNKQDEDAMYSDFINYLAYSFDSTLQFYESYSYIHGLKTEINKNLFSEIYLSFDSNNLKMNWTITPTFLKAFKSVTAIFCAVVFLICLTATIFAVKKTVELNSGEIGILKAMGVKNWEISCAYLSYGIIVTVVVAPLSWILGSFIQDTLTTSFLEFFSGRSHIAVFDPTAILVSILVFGVLLCVISFMTSFLIVRRPTIKIINRVEKNKRIAWLDNWKNKTFRNKTFATRFSLELAISGFSKTLLSASTIFVAAFIVSFGLTFPGIVQNVVGSYYKNVHYQNSYKNTDLVGNAPLAKTSLSVTKDVEEYENDLFDSKGIFGKGISMISKDLSNFSSTPDTSGIPQILLTGENYSDFSAQWTYDKIFESEGGISVAGEESIISIIASLLGNNISHLVGKGIAISDIQKIIEWVIHSDKYSAEDFGQRLERVNQLSDILTNGLPEILSTILKTAASGEGDWKEQIIDLIISQTPAYLKQYVTRSENRLNNFSFGWQINKYNPGVDDLYTSLDVGSQNGATLNLTGLQSTQNAYRISEDTSKQIFITDYQANVMEKIINNYSVDQSEVSAISDYYNAANRTLEIPIVSNKQTSFLLGEKWENLQNPLITKTRLTIRTDNANIPNQAWMYNDGDWNSYKNATTYSDSYIEMIDLSASKFTFAPVFEDSNKLMDNSFGFYNLTSEATSKGENLNFEIRPYYQFENIILFVPNKFKSGFEDTKSKGNQSFIDKWWIDSVANADVPENTKRGWEKNDSTLENSDYFAVRPYSPYYNASKNYEKEETNLSGTAIQLMTTPYENFFARALREPNGAITYGDVNLNWVNQNYYIDTIKFKNVDSIEIYGNPIIIADQNIVNMLSGFDIAKYVPFSYRYEDPNVAPVTYQNNGVSVDIYSYIDPLAFNDYNTQDLVYGSTAIEKSIRPSQWYTGVFSSAPEPYFITTQASFSRDKKLGVDVMNGANYGNSIVEITSTKLLSQQRALINQVTLVILSLAFIAIIFLVIIIILTITLINDLYVNQYRKFMIVMKSLGYSNWSIIKYTFGTMTITSIIFYVLGVATNFTVIGIIFRVVSKSMGYIPFGLTWWTPILAVILVFGAFFISIGITTRKIRKESPSTLVY